MAWLDTALVLSILAFIAILVWSKVQDQTVADTVREIMEIIREIGHK